MATLVVTLDFDHVVLASDKMHSALGYYSHHIDRRSIMILAGPKTDRNMLQNAMNEMTTQKLQLILYSASGAEQHVMVSCSSCMYGDFGSACLVVLHSSEAIPLSEAFGLCSASGSCLCRRAQLRIHDQPSFYKELQPLAV